MIPFSSFTVDNGAITDLRELVFSTLYNDPDIQRVMRNETGVTNGKKLGFIHSMGDVGKNKSGCNPTYDSVNIVGREKVWAPGPWQIAEKLCYADLENTIAKHALNTGTAVANLQDTPYWDLVLMPLLQRSIVEMYWRIAWFGDKQAKNIANSGLITAGIDTSLFTMCDGLWKRIKGIVAENTGQLTVIEANTAKENVNGTQTITYNSQKQAIRQEGVAIGIVDEMLSDCDSRIFDDADAAIYMTNSLFKALRNDVKRLHNLQLQVEHVSSGIQLSNYDGHPVIVLDIWDRMIKKYEDNGTCLNAPHRALIATPNNLFVGTTDSQRIADLNVWFDDTTRLNHIYAQSDIDTLVGEDELIQAAF